jgi:hypothetical protein
MTDRYGYRESSIMSESDVKAEEDRSLDTHEEPNEENDVGHARL